MAIYLVQHGKSLPKDVDPEKGLSEEGKKEVERVASAAKKCGLNVTSIRHSGKKRALQTAEIFESFLKCPDGVREVSGLAPLDDVAGLAEGLDPKENIMFVGHLPFMEKLVSYLISGSAEKPVVRFRNGGIVCLEEDAESGAWVITCMLMPDIV
jgi:phosphohistidine phosphatase